MEALEQTCKVENGYKLFEPFTKAGWSFFNLQISEEMFSVIEKSGMMDGALGYRISEQTKIFFGTLSRITRKSGTNQEHRILIFVTIIL